MLVQVKVEGILIDVTTNGPVVVLKDVAKDRVLPIWIGSVEANAIEMGIEEIKAPRPLTHDLLCHILEAMKVKVEKICVNELRDTTFIASITLIQNGKEIEIDARPSDAIAVALRAGATIFVEESLLRETPSSEEGEGGNKSDAEKKQFQDFLSQIKPDDFKYKH